MNQYIYCPHSYHNFICPRVRVIEYYPNGCVKRIEFFSPPQQYEYQLPPVWIQPVYPAPPWTVTCGGTVVTDRITITTVADEGNQ